MEWIYPFLVTFMLVFFSELGDKTQLLVLSFSATSKAKNILLGVAIGTFFSHGLAILFGSQIVSFVNDDFQFYLKVLTYASFLLFGILGFLPHSETNSSPKSTILQKLSYLKINYIWTVALCILIGELGDKTFLASLGVGMQYPSAKISLILGSICGMVVSNSIAIFFGKLLGKHFKQEWIEFLSNVIFLVFGILGFLHLFYTYFLVNLF